MGIIGIMALNMKLSWSIIKSIKYVQHKRTKQKGRPARRPILFKDGFHPARCERLSASTPCFQYLRALTFNISEYHMKVNEGIMNKEFKSMFVVRDF